MFKRLTITFVMCAVYAVAGLLWSCGGHSPTKPDSIDRLEIQGVIVNSEDVQLTASSKLAMLWVVQHDDPDSLYVYVGAAQRLLNTDTSFRLDFSSDLPDSATSLLSATESGGSALRYGVALLVALEDTSDVIVTGRYIVARVVERLFAEGLIGAVENSGVIYRRSLVQVPLDGPSWLERFPMGMALAVASKNDAGIYSFTPVNLNSQLILRMVADQESIELPNVW